MSKLRSLIDSSARNVAFSWLLLAAGLVVAGATLAGGDPLWAGLAASVVAVALVPTIVTRDPTVVVAWEALLVTLLPLAARAVGVAGERAAYVAVAGLALVVVVEITAFSSAEMPSWFAVVFVVALTLTAAAVWGIVQFGSDWYLGTSFIAGRADLMWDLVGATGIGILAGVVFELYFRRAAQEPTVPGGG